MAVILQFVAPANPLTQAHLERDDAPWWVVKGTAWKERNLPDTVLRKTEISALRNIEVEARALKHLHKNMYVLKPTERELLNCERECLRRNVALVNPFDRSSWIAAQMGGEWNAKGVRMALADISQILIAAEDERVTEVLVQWGRRKIARRAAAWIAEDEKAA